MAGVETGAAGATQSIQHAADHTFAGAGYGDAQLPPAPPTSKLNQHDIDDRSGASQDPLAMLPVGGK